MPGLAVAQTQTGLPPWATYGGGPIDHINLQTFAIHFTIPIISKTGRGLPFDFVFRFDNTGSVASTAASLAGSLVAPTSRQQVCVVHDHFYYEESTSVFSFVDPSGVIHTFIDPSTGEAPFGRSARPTQCGHEPAISQEGYATDGSGYKAFATGTGAHVVGPDGTNYYHNLESPDSSAFSVADRNGNTITSDSTGTIVTDTLGVTELTVTGSPAAGSMTYAYPGPTGTANVVVTYNTSNGDPTNIALADGTSYSITWGSYGVSSITLPSGGEISYTYTGPTTAPTEVVRKVTGVPNSGTWTYQFFNGATNVTDPNDNLTTYEFFTYNAGQETYREIYSGSTVTPSQLRFAEDTCYGASVDGCNSGPASPFMSEIDTEIGLPDGRSREVKTLLNYTNGAPSEVDQTDWTTSASAEGGAVLRKTMYAYLNSDYDFPSSVKVENAGGTVESETDYAYDQTAVQATTGTPSHSSYVSGERFNPTTITYQVNASKTLTKTISYYDTGLPYQVTDVNGGITTYTYSSAGCAPNSLPTSVTGPTGLTTSLAWNCDGGVITSSTGANGQTSSWSYGSPYGLWSPTEMTDPRGDVTSYTYTPANGSTPETTETATTFNGGNSTSDVLTTYDGLGRPYLVQRREAPGSSSFDSVETYYNGDGEAYRTSVPYVAAAGAGYSGSAFNTTTFDALGRPLVETGAGGATTTYSYPDNDTEITTGPAPATGKQLEYNGLGELTSVCETTAQTGNGACGQSHAENGYLTTYSYDALGDITAVEEDAQPNGSPQNRTFSFDELGRLTSETTPEAGTTTFAFGTGANCSGTYYGDVAERTDAMGNVTCYTYDKLHRLTSATYPSGPYAAATPPATFVYDAATVDNASMAYAAGRLAEAYTGPSGAKITDLGFSYGPLGKAVAVYESAPHSGSYYVSTASWHANGALKTLTVPGVPGMTYGLDGEGRPTTVTAASGQSPVTAAQYGLDGLTSLSLGSLDSDGYQYEPDTGRMTQYQFTVDGATDTGTLGWNTNGTLASLDIADDVPGASDTQNCAYTHDDLGRIQNVNCGTALTEDFSFDAFGNVLSNGSSDPGMAFSATYTGNRISGQDLYDADGNLVSDPVAPAPNANAFDANGNAVQLESIAVTYDALGRAVEAAKPSGTVEFLYGPGGARLAVMSGQTLEQATIALPGGDEAVYDASGLEYYGHADGLGNIRLASTPSRTLYAATAYSAYGATYDEAGQNLRVFTGQAQEIDGTFSGGQYDFPMREYNPIQGRWWTPDPAGLGAVNPNDPQSWNAYAYVEGTPMEATDPLGLDGSCHPGPKGEICTVTAPPVWTPIFACQGSYDAGCRLPPFRRQCIFNPWACNPPARPPFGGGGGGGSHTARTTTTKPPSLLAKVGSNLQCAAKFANKYSIAGGLHAAGIGNNGGIGGFLTNALGGNVFADAIEDFGGGRSGGQTVAALARTDVVSANADAATKRVVGAAWKAVTGAGEAIQTINGSASIASTTVTVARAGSVVGDVLVVYSAVSLGVGVLNCL